MGLDVPVNGASDAVLGRTLPNLRAHALSCRGREEAPTHAHCSHEGAHVALRSEACEEPVPHEWLSGEWAGGRVALQSGGIPRVSPSSSYRTHHPPTIPHLFLGL